MLFRQVTGMVALMGCSLGVVVTLVELTNRPQSLKERFAALLPEKIEEIKALRK